MLKKGKLWEWTAKESFEALKKVLSTAPLLTPDPERDCERATAASGCALGTVISQNQGYEVRLIACHICIALAEKNQAVHETDMFSVVIVGLGFGWCVGRGGGSRFGGGLSVCGSVGVRLRLRLAARFDAPRRQSRCWCLGLRERSFLRLVVGERCLLRLGVGEGERRSSSDELRIV